MSDLFVKQYRPPLAEDAEETFSLGGLSWWSPCKENEFSSISEQGSQITGTLVKKTSKRTVIKHDGYFIKQNTYQGIRPLLKRLSGGLARCEAEICLQLAKLGIEVPVVLSVGEALENGTLQRDLLVTREVPNSNNLDHFLETTYQALPHAQKRHLVETFAHFIKGLHERGVFHADLHLGNILCVVKGLEYSFVLLDADQVVLKDRPLQRQEEVHSLAILLNSVRSRTSRTEQFRFLKAYGIRLDDSCRDFLNSVACRHLRLAQRVWRKQAGRSLKSNSRFVAETVSGFNVWRKRQGLDDEVLQTLLQDPDGLLDKGEVLKSGNTVKAGIVTIAGQKYFLKRFNVKGQWYRFRNAFRKSRAVRTWRNSWAFRVRNLPVAEPLVCFETRRSRLLGESYILSEYVADSFTVADLWPRLNDKQKEKLTIRCGLLIGEMHRTCCLHGDLKWKNFLVCADDKLVPIIIDLDGSRVTSSVNRGRCVKDLQRFLKDFSVVTDDREWKKLFSRVWGGRTGISL